MDFDVLSALIGLLTGAAGASGFWFFKYNDIKLALTVERDLNDGLVQSLDARK